MFNYICGERQKGRFPNSIELLFVEIPQLYRRALEKSRTVASKEVTPT